MPAQVLIDLEAVMTKIRSVQAVLEAHIAAHPDADLSDIQANVDGLTVDAQALADTVAAEVPAT
jgi:hypothetical protein